MTNFFIYNSENTRDKKLLEVVLRENLHMHIIDINQGLEQQLVGYIEKIPLKYLAEMLDERVVKSNKLDNNLKLIRFLENRPRIMKTPVIITDEKSIPVNDEADILSEEFVA